MVLTARGHWLKLTQPLRLACRGVAGVAVLVGVSLSTQKADACSYLPTEFYATYPEDGAQNVPTNAVLFVYGPRVTAEASPTLYDADGTVVPTTLREVESSGFDVVPTEALLPNHGYELRDATEGPYSTVSFTTGSEAAALPETLSPVDFSARLFDYNYSSCGEATLICLDIAQVPNATLEVRAGQEVLLFRAGKPTSLQYGKPLPETACIEVRVRDVLGQRSQPTTLCNAELERTHLDEEVVRDLEARLGRAGTCDELANAADSESNPIAGHDAGTPGVDESDGADGEKDVEGPGVVAVAAGPESNSMGCSVRHVSSGGSSHWLFALAGVWISSASRRMGRGSGRSEAPESNG